MSAHFSSRSRLFYPYNPTKKGQSKFEVTLKCFLVHFFFFLSSWTKCGFVSHHVKFEVQRFRKFETETPLSPSKEKKRGCRICFFLMILCCRKTFSPVFYQWIEKNIRKKKWHSNSNYTEKMWNVKKYFWERGFLYKTKKFFFLVLVKLEKKFWNKKKSISHK